MVKILHNLSRAGIIETKEGKFGGVRLIVSPEKLTLLMIFDAIEQDRPLFQTHLDLKATGPKPDKVKKELLNTLKSAEMAMKDSLKAITLEVYLRKLRQ